MKSADVDKYERLIGQIQSVYDEMSQLSKKSPDTPINKFKIGHINSLLSKCNDLLGKKYRPIDDFSQFDEDIMPFNSDVVFILAQYIQYFEKLKADHVEEDDYSSWFWKVNESKRGEGDENGFVYIPTVKPKRIR